MSNDIDERNLTVSYLYSDQEAFDLIFGAVKEEPPNSAVISNVIHDRLRYYTVGFGRKIDRGFEEWVNRYMKLVEDSEDIKPVLKLKLFQWLYEVIRIAADPVLEKSYLEEFHDEAQISKTIVDKFKTYINSEHLSEYEEILKREDIKNKYCESFYEEILPTYLGGRKPKTQKSEWCDSTGPNINFFQSGERSKWIKMLIIAIISSLLLGFLLGKLSNNNSSSANGLHGNDSFMYEESDLSNQENDSEGLAEEESTESKVVSGKPKKTTESDEDVVENSESSLTGYKHEVGDVITITETWKLRSAPDLSDNEVSGDLYRDCKITVNEVQEMNNIIWYTVSFNDVYLLRATDEIKQMANTRSMKRVLPVRSSLWKNYKDPDPIMDLNEGIAVKIDNAVADANGDTWFKVQIPEKYYVTFKEQYNNPTENNLQVSETDRSEE